MSTNLEKIEQAFLEANKENIEARTTLVGSIISDLTNAATEHPQELLQILSNDSVSLIMKHIDILTDSQIMVLTPSELNSLERMCVDVGIDSYEKTLQNNGDKGVIINPFKIDSSIYVIEGDKVVECTIKIIRIVINDISKAPCHELYIASKNGELLVGRPAIIMNAENPDGKTSNTSVWITDSMLGSYFFMTKQDAEKELSKKK